jgi:hypothetical protein
MAYLMADAIGFPGRRFPVNGSRTKRNGTRVWLHRPASKIQFEMDQAADFAEWLRVALAGATPYQARMWGGEGIALRRHCT